jgi:hypothetical protein
MGLKRGSPTTNIALESGTPFVALERGTLLLVSLRDSRAFSNRVIFIGVA